ncbi:MAG: hypothetical protein IKG97_05835 [Lachnospiraceae bacterium]|nr:hypothetical protein [Lachnospiraceae bacterium]
MRSGFRKKLDDLNLKIESAYRKHSYRKKARIRLKRMNGGFKCDREYKEIILPFWEKYGYKPEKYWYRIFCDADQKVDPRYIPDDLYYGELIPYFSNSQFRRFGEDKCYHDVWFPEIRRPETVVKNIAGVYYDPDMKPVTMDEAVSRVLSFREESLIKPSIDSGEGRLIRFFDPKSVSEDEVRSIFREMGANFIVQAVVKQHEMLAKMNPTSLNTIRVVTFFFENEVHVLSCIYRVGAPNARVDNIGAGGYACPVHKDGRLNEKAVNRKAEWEEQNSAGIRFADITVPNYEKVIETVKKAHLKLAHFKLIGWDMTVDTEGEPVMIEFNTCPGSNQICDGPTFGDLTERVLDEYFNKRTLASAQN